MRGVEEIKKKSTTLYNNSLFLSKLIFKNDSEFPLSIPLQAPSSRELLKNFSSLSKTIDELTKASKKQIGFGYELDFHEINSRSLGKQRLPQKAIFYNSYDFLMFLGKKDEINQMQSLTEHVIKELPSLSSLLKEQPDLTKIDLRTWERFTLVCKFFLNNQVHNHYLRSLEIKGVDSKFIETHQKQISLFLDKILPEENVNKRALVSERSGFEKRYKMKYDPPKVRLRILDKTLINHWSHFSDIQVTIDELASTEPPCDRVIIAENKINGLILPNFSSTIVIFGLGSSVSLLKDIHWLNQKQIAYWGDIDTWGFSILSNLRGHFPHTQSILMDRGTFNKFQSLSTEEPIKAEINAPSSLSKEELGLYKDLITASPKEKTRLEQERIPLSYCLQHIDKWFKKR